MHPSPALVPHDASLLGARLRALRKERGLSLMQVAEATGISSSFLSLVETGRCDLSVGRLLRLMSLFEVSLDQLLAGDRTRDTVVVRADERPRIASEEERMEVFLLARGEDHSMLPALLTIEPGGGLPSRVSHQTELFVHVVEGTLTLELADETIRLERGDSAYFDGRRPHRMSNAEETDVVILTVNTPPALSSLHTFDR